MLLTLALTLTAASVQNAGAYVTEIAFQAPDKLGACAVGDVDPSRPGDEIVTVCRTGEVFVLARGERGFDAWRVATTPGEMIQVALGDVLADRPGLEIVAVGAAEGGEADDEPGAAWVVWREGGEWRSRQVYESPKLLHAVTVNAGRILVAGYDRDLVAVEHDGEWWSRTVGRLPGPGKCAVTSDGVSYLACKDGSVVAARRHDSGFDVVPLHRRNAGRARLDALGGHVLVCDDDGTLSLATLDGESEIVHREGDKLRGAVLADLDPSVPGVELATAGYERRLTVLARHDGAWTATPVAVETDRFHGLASGDLDGDGDEELVACGYSGRLLVVDCLARPSAGAR